jgi:hypothetical protein
LHVAVIHWEMERREAECLEIELMMEGSSTSKFLASTKMQTRRRPNKRKRKVAVPVL